MSCSRQPQRPSLRSLATGLLAFAAFGAAAATPASAAPMQAAPVSQFRDSAGVNMHTTFVNYAGDLTSVTTLKYMLKTLGIWHVRDNVCLAKESECERPRLRLSQLSDAMGANGPKVDLLLNLTTELDQHPDRIVRDADIQRALTAMATEPLAGHVAALEETNEPDLQGVKDWAARTLADHATVKRMLADPQFSSLASLPLVGPSMGHPDATPSLTKAGWSTALDVTPNFHPYPPAWGGPENALGVRCTKDFTVFGCANLLGPEQPWATEAGYSTTGSIAAATWVSRLSQATYLPRLLLDNFSNGVARTYLYELIDRSPDPTSDTNGWGLWKSRFKGMNQIVSGGIKPAALAIGRMNARLGDAGAPAEPGSLDLDITDENGKPIADTTVRRVLLRRADGTFALALWQPKGVYSTVAFKQRTTAVADTPVTVKVNTAAAGNWTATTFRPTLDQYATQAAKTTTFTVPVGADVSIIDLRPGDDATPVPGGGYAIRGSNLLGD